MDETRPEAAARRRGHPAVTAALGNATALGLGFAYLRRWPEFGLTLACTTAIGAVIWNAEPPPPKFWFFAVATLALITAAAGWRIGRNAAWEADEHTIERLTVPRPFSGRFWAPANLIVLAAYAGAYLWVVTDAGRLHQVQAEAHADGDCEEAVAQVDRVNRGQRIFAADRYEAMVAQAEACRYYIDAQWQYTGEPRTDAISNAITLLERYLEQPEPLLAAQVEQQMDQMRAELLLMLIRDHSDAYYSYRMDLLEKVQATVEGAPDSPLAQETVTALRELTAQWHEDAGDAARACTVSRTVEGLVESALEPGPVVDPLLEAAASVRPDAAVVCVRAAMDAWSESGDGEEFTDGRARWAVGLLQMVVDRYADHDRAADAAAMLEELEGRV